MEFDDDPTNLDEIPVLEEADTAKHKSLDFLAGREKGFSEGVEAAAAALKAELVKAGIVGEECLRILRKVWDGALKKG